MSKHSRFYELSKKRVLDNAELAEWLRELENRLSQSSRMTGSKPGRTELKPKT